MKRRVYISFLIIPLLLANVAFSQLEATNWYFGSTCSALKFLPTGTVTVAPNGYTPFGAEGCSVLSDPQTGTLKFYTDGNTVIDNTHHVMPNGYGLVALTSSWGSGKIVMDPLTCSRYYIFHNDGTGEGIGQKRLYYSMVDLNLAGNGTVFNPKGDVSPSIKNILISNNVVEGIEIAPASTNHDFWILATSNAPSALHVYKFTSETPSLVNSYPLLNQPSDIRAIRFCETNNKLAIASCNDFEDVLVMDFNTTTGEITNQTIVPSFPARMNGVGNGVYDLCWSPDGSKLYISKYTQGQTGGKLYQHNFSNASTQLIYDVNATSNLFPAKGLKRGPDGKIYFMYTTADGQMRFIGAINNPNNPPETCNFNPRQVNMSADIRSAGKFPDFVYSSNRLKQYADTTVNINTPCNFTSLEMDMYLPLEELDNDKDHLTYAILSVHSATATATLINSSLKYKNTAKPSYTDTVTIQYCDDYCIKKCKTFHVIIHVNAMSSTLNLPDSITSCVHDPIQLDAGAGFKSYAWSTGETTQKIFVSNNGTYKVTAEDANGCVYSDSTTVTFKSQLIFSLGNDTAACDSFLLKLNSPFSHILWSTGSSADSIIIRTSGSYSVMVTNKEGCSASDTISVIVYNPPAVNLGGPYNYCENIPIHQIFKITGMKDIFWSTGSTQDSIIVTTPGTYTVRVTDTKGCKASGQVTVATLPLPIPAFTLSDACAGVNNTFTDASAIASGKIQKRLWDFGDGTALQFDSIVQHAYLTPGMFQVKLIVTSDGNCTDSVTHALSVFDLPAVAFDYKIVCPGNRIELLNNSTSQNPIVEWKWNFGNGTTDQQKDPMHTFVLKGTYPVSLTAKTDKGCLSSLTKQVVIQTALKANFTTRSSCEGKKIMLTDQSSIDEPSQIKYLWDFGDGTPLSTEKFPEHVYQSHGDYLIKLILFSNSGCGDSISKKIRIHPNPMAAFRATNATGCSPLATSFVDESTIQSGKIVNWQWQLGIRNSTAQNPEQVYRNLSSTVAKYDVRLIVASDSGCAAELLKPNYINIYPSPRADFSLSPKIVSVADAIISFKNNSLGTDSVFWDFGDHIHSSDFNTAPHQYTSPDTFTVKLIVYTRYGCTDTISKQIIVQPEFTFYIPNSFSPNDDGLNDYFSGKGEEVLEYEMVVFNRLGEVMFRTTDMNVAWNGSKNNNSELAAEDVYVYTVNIVDRNKKKHFYKGIVTLVK